jgi:hypothetical protein
MLDIIKYKNILLRKKTKWLQTISDEVKSKNIEYYRHIVSPPYSEMKVKRICRRHAIRLPLDFHSYILLIDFCIYFCRSFFDHEFLI